MERLSQSNIIKNAYEPSGAESCKKTKKGKRVVILREKIPDVVTEWKKGKKKPEDDPEIKNAVSENFLNDFREFSSSHEKRV